MGAHCASKEQPFKGHGGRPWEDVTPGEPRGTGSNVPNAISVHNPVSYHISAGNNLEKPRICTLIHAIKALCAHEKGGPPGPRAREKCPLLVSDVLLSHGLLRSTIGARGLNFRVRNGTGCASPAMVADQQGAFCYQGRHRAVPWGPHSVTSRLREDRVRAMVRREELGRLVPLDSTPRSAYICGLSNS